MCANLLYNRVCLWLCCARLCIEFHFSLGSLPLLIITYYPPHVHHCSIHSLSFSCILLNRHLFSAHIIHSFTHILSVSLSVCICGCAFHLSAFIERSISMWNYFFASFSTNRTMPIACSYLQVPYSTRIIDEFSLIVSVRLVWLSFFSFSAIFLRWNGNAVATEMLQVEREIERSR